MKLHSKIMRRAEPIAREDSDNVDVYSIGFVDGVHKEHARLKPLIEALAKAVAALEYYAATDNWQYTTYDHSGQISNDDYGVIKNRKGTYSDWEFGGHAAREALSSLAGTLGDE